MFGIHDLWLFVISGLALNVTPGPDLLYISGRSAAHGARVGAVAAFGVAAGCWVHILAAALGLSALLAASSAAFTVVKLAGACYLVYVGLAMVLSKGHGAGHGPAAERSGDRLGASTRKVFMQGFLTNALNPKVALFFLAFLPQFIDPAATGKAYAFLLLGGIFNCTGLMVCLAAAWLSARALSGVRDGRFGTWFNRGIGGMFVLLGARLAFSDNA